MDRKLADIDVLQVRAACILNHKKYGSQALAKLFCVSRTTIERIVNRETYRHLPPRMPPDVLVEQRPVLVGVVVTRGWEAGNLQNGPSARLAVDGETPDWYMTAFDFDTYHGFGADFGGKNRKGKIYVEEVTLNWPPPGKVHRLTALEYEQEARWSRRLIFDYAKQYRERHGLELKKQRGPKRTSPPRKDGPSGN